MADLGQKGEQLQMFMTPREIVSKYQALDGDRQEYYADRDTWNTARSANTAGDRNHPRMKGDGEGGMRPFNTSEHEGRPYSYSVPTETDEQVWARKLDESQMTASDLADERGESLAFSKNYIDDYSGSLKDRSSYPNTSDYDNTDDLYDDRYEYKAQKQYDYEDFKSSESLYDSVGNSGVQYPVHLGSQFGSQGKREVVGGHHRIAAALDIAPDQPIPVLHHKGLSDARSDSNKSVGFGYR